MEDLDVSEEQRKATLRDGQDAGEMLLDIEARIGELLPKPQDAGSVGGGSGPTGRAKRDSRISEKRAVQARAIARNPKVVEDIKRQGALAERSPFLQRSGWLQHNLLEAGEGRIDLLGTHFLLLL